MATQGSTLSVEIVAACPGWRVQHVICGAGPRDRPFEEQHGSVSLGAVLSGSFRYRTAQGSALLSPGAILLGNHGQGFECSHEHGTGDRCISLHYEPEYWENLVAGIPGASRAQFRLPHLPPAAAFSRVFAELELALAMGASALEELAIEIAGVVVRAESRLAPSLLCPSARDERRISAAVRKIEHAACELEERALTVGGLARESNMTPYHFLRTFRRVVGMTPHQYVLWTRLHRAAVRLRASGEPISSIAYGAGFNDLSTFNRRFRRLMGDSPRAYRNEVKPSRE